MGGWRRGERGGEAWGGAVGPWSTQERLLKHHPVWPLHTLPSAGKSPPSPYPPPCTPLPSTGKSPPPPTHLLLPNAPDVSIEAAAQLLAALLQLLHHHEVTLLAPHLQGGLRGRAWVGGAGRGWGDSFCIIMKSRSLRRTYREGERAGGGERQWDKGLGLISSQQYPLRCPICPS